MSEPLTDAIIFLDIDGVLNGHNWSSSAESNIIQPTPVKHLNRILEETGAKIVLSSSWRYIIHGGAMTLDGFEYMLRTHGVVSGRLRGLTCKDEETKGAEPDDFLSDGYSVRSKQILGWLQMNTSVTRWVAIDDGGLDIDDENFVQTDGRVGLTEADALRAIELLSPVESSSPLGALEKLGEGKE